MPTAFRISIIATALLLTIPSAGAQPGPRSQPDRTIDARERLEVIEGALRHLNTAYVFPEMAKKMEAAIRARLERKEYDAITSAELLAKTLTSHLQDMSRDKHLSVAYSHEPRPERPQGPPSPDERARALENARRGNFGFERVERLTGNVGYLDLRGFNGMPEAGDTAVAVMNFLANSDALIVDLRQNGGGSPAMIGILSSYLFDDVVHLNDFYWRESNETRQFWTSPYVQGRRYGVSKPVYVLTSNRTFSAAEEFTYNLKNLKRATIVGETTGGGAHPGGPRRITDHFVVWVPAGRAINPITKGNWEGTGIEPDVKVEARLALKTAHLDALQKLLAAATDARVKEQLERARGDVQRELEELKASPAKTTSSQ